jgi:hypothetical protein
VAANGLAISRDSVNALLYNGFEVPRRGRTGRANLSDYRSDGS